MAFFSAQAFLLLPPPATALLPPPATGTPILSLHKKTHFVPSLQFQKSSLKLYSTSSFCRPIRCSVAVAVADSSSAPENGTQTSPSPAEVSRTIMELSSPGTLSTVTEEGWPLGISARFVVDGQGIPALCLSPGEDDFFSVGSRSCLHVKLEQSGSRTPHCTLMGYLTKPEDRLLIKKLETNWEKKFGEELDSNLLYVISVERVLYMGDFKERGTWVNSLEYLNADPDPLRNFAEKIVDEMNSKHSEDVQRLFNIYVDTKLQVIETKMIWVDRLGFDLHIHSNEGVFEGRIPFPREVSDEKAVKSSFNCMSHLAWEIEKNFVAPDFEKVKLLKRIR